EHRTMAEELRHDSWDYRSARSSVGMPFVTLCVMDLRHVAYSGEAAERPERHATRSIARWLKSFGTTVGIIVPHAPAWECRS
ncbi:hypothetical protein, partial [Pseudomonas syringae group sp. J248-6]|uniref:hypothetical protein n=1 Tax=Pseudomonas syringae group sp. J248-6 TaxID=3079590 RepID=UPI00290A09FC